MLNSDLSPPNHKHSRRSRKQQQIGAKSPSLLPQGGRPAYQQAVQKASDLLGMPLALISLFSEEERIVAAIGLEFLGELPSLQALGIQGCSQFLERSHQCLASADVLQDETYFDRHQVKIAAYLGVALWTRGGDCVGTLAVMDRQVREFTERDHATLHLVADWLMCELEREILFKAQVAGFFDLPLNPVVEKSISMEAEAKFNLLSHLSQSLRTPLTAVLGMTGVLQRELYGPLNDKQQSYMSVVHHSGQQLAALVDEIASLGALEQIDSRLTFKAADVEMLCQQSIRDLDGVMKQRRQHVEVAIELTNRIWLLDRDKVRQILYYLLLHTLHCLPPEAVIGMIVSATGDRLVIEIQGLPPRSTGTNLRILPLPQQPVATTNVDVTHTQLGLVLSHVLTEAHEGSLDQIGTYGHRLLLPLITSDLEEIISHDS